MRRMCKEGCGSSPKVHPRWGSVERGLGNLTPKSWWWQVPCRGCNAAAILDGLSRKMAMLLSWDGPTGLGIKMEQPSLGFCLQREKVQDSTLDLGEHQDQENKNQPWELMTMPLGNTNKPMAESKLLVACKVLHDPALAQLSSLTPHYPQILLQLCQVTASSLALYISYSLCQTHCSLPSLPG